jgi:hypothetical protein
VANGHPRNSGPTRYQVTRPCCQFTYSDTAGYQCAKEIDPSMEIPQGDPYGGGDWSGTGKDTGTFDGATAELVL